MDEFNTKFRRVVADLPNEIKPKDGSILIYYIEYFTGDLRYQLRDKEPTNLKNAQELAEKIEKNMQSSGKFNILGYAREKNLWCVPMHAGKGLEESLCRTTMWYVMSQEI